MLLELFLTQFYSFCMDELGFVFCEALLRRRKVDIFNLLSYYIFRVFGVI